jgi:hypothetical protein
MAMSSLKEKVARIQEHFSGAIGSKLIAYETAELRELDGQWSPWPDLPIRLHLDSGQMIAVSWSNFDDLWLASDLSLPFEAELEDAEVRWVRNAISPINPVLGSILRSVQLGRGNMSIEGREIEIWTRLLLQFPNHCLEIFNALDENGYQLHSNPPDIQTIPCT